MQDVKIIPTLLVAVLTLTILFGCSKEQNVIIITFDALRADRVSSDNNITPNIDKLASRSIVFSNAISQCGSTTCSLPSLFTSKYPYSDNILSSGSRLKESELTLAEILKQHGYKTIAIVAVPAAYSQSGLSQGFDVYQEGFDWYEPGDITRRRVEKELENVDEPFFLWIHFRQPHGPYTPKSHYFHSRYNHDDKVTFYSKDLENLAFYDKWRQLLNVYIKNESVYQILFAAKKLNATATIIEQLVAAYEGNLMEVDHEFGILMDFFEKKNILDNSIIVVAADHGESLGEHNIIDHNDLYYGIVHTPIIYFINGSSHNVLNHPVMNVDIVPTILNDLNISIPPDMRGNNLLHGHTYQYSEFLKKQTLIIADYKLIMDNLDEKLFNIKDDPNETQEITINMTQLREFHQIKDHIMNNKDLNQDSTLELLRSIGYAN